MRAVDLLLDLARRHGATLILCTHDLGLVLPRVDRLLGLREGRLTLDLPAAAVQPSDLAALYAGSHELR